MTDDGTFSGRVAVVTGAARGIGDAIATRLAARGARVVSLDVGDAFLLCSDGVWSLMSDPEITACLSKATTPLDWCVALEHQLRERSTADMLEEQDNYSMITAMVMS